MRQKSYDKPLKLSFTLKNKKKPNQSILKALIVVWDCGGVMPQINSNYTATCCKTLIEIENFVVCPLSLVNVIYMEN